MAARSIDKRVARRLRRATSIPPYISSGSMASNPPSPIGSGLMVYGC